MNDIFKSTGTETGLSIFNQMAEQLDLGENTTQKNTEVETYNNNKLSSEYWIPLVNSFWSKNDKLMPVPFVELQNLLWEHRVAKADYASMWDKYTGDIEDALFLRLFACYRHGLDWAIVLKQIQTLPVKDVHDDSLDNDPTYRPFWLKQYKILRHKLIPYVLVNRYIIMPINRVSYWVFKIMKLL